MKRFFFVVAVLIAVWFVAWQIAAQWPSSVPPRVADSMAPDMFNLNIAPREEALTFARYLQGEQPHLLLVNAFQGGKAFGIDLQQALPGSPDDPISLFNKLGYQGLQALEGEKITVDQAALLLPFAGTDNQVAVGINYPEHSAETSVRDSFLFPKRTLATPFRSDVTAGEHLLDYEIELGFVLLKDLVRGQQPDFIGLVLASDYTDRAELMRHAKLTEVSSGVGFTQGKSEPGFMPVGNLLVIPRDYAAFYPDLQLDLWHNGKKRQEAHPRDLIWNFPRILTETFARADKRWQWRDVEVRLPIEGGRIPARTVFLSGTPGGVIYQQPNARHLFLGISEMLFTLQVNNLNAVVEPFLREEFRSGRYLKAGDRVEMRADKLGLISNSIIDR